MAGSITGSVSVEVVPDAKRWASRLRAAILGDAEQIGAEFGKAFGAAASKTIGDAVAKGVEKSAREAERAAPAQGAAVGGKFAAALKARLEAALRDMPEIKLDADTDPARRELAEIRAEMKALADLKIGVDLDAATAQARLAALQERLKALSASDVDLQVRVDAGAAAAELVLFDAEVDRLDGREVDVQVDADTSRARAELEGMGASGNVASGRILALVGAIGLIGPALGPLAALAAGAFSAIAVGAAAAATGVGVLVLALAPVISATQAVMQNQNRANTASAQAESRAFALASAQDSLKAALRGVASAQADAANAAERSDRKIADARRRVEDVVRSAASSIARADRSVASAEKNLADAQRDALRAQQNLTDARRQYAQDQEDLASRLANGALDEREAVLRLAEAKEELAKAEADPRVNAIDREQARLAVDQAVQGLKDQQTENRRLAEEKAKADRDGVDGSEKVKNATQQLEDANQRVADSEERVQLAVEARAEAQRSAARDIAEAQQNVAEAQRDAAEQQRRSAESIASAQQAVVNAHRAVEQASVRSATAGGVAMEAMQKKLAALSPAGRTFVKFLTDELIPEFQRLSRIAQTGFLPGLTDGMRSLIESGPEFDQVVKAISTTLGDMAREAGKALTSPFWKDFLRFMRDEFPPVLRSLGTIFGNIAKAFAGFMIAMAPVNTMILKALTGLSGKLAALATDTDPNSPIQRFVRFMTTEGPKVGSALMDIVGAIGTLIVKLAPLGVKVIEATAAIVGFIAALPKPVLEGIALGIGAVALAIAGLNFQMAITALGPGAAYALAIGAIAAIMVIAYRNSQPFRDIVQKVWKVLKDAGTVITSQVHPAIAGLAKTVREDLGPAFAGLIEAMGPLVKWLVEKLAPVIATQFKVIIKVIDVALQVISGLINLWVGVCTLDWSKAWTGIKQIFGSVWDEIRVLLDAGWVLIKGAFTNGAESITKAWSGLWEGIKKLTTGAWTLIKGAFTNGAESVTKAWKGLWEGLKSIFSAFKITVMVLMYAAWTLIKGAFTNGAESVKKTWNGLWTALKSPIATTFTTIKTAIDKGMAGAKSAFATGVAGIKSAWDKLTDVAKTPVRFVINTVMGGLATKFNSISSKVGGPTLPVPSVNFADGGVLPGYTPGRDVHQFFSPTAGFLALSGGEAVMRPEFTRAVGGEAGIEALNRLARQGAPLVEMFGQRRFADGGVLNFIKSKAASTWDWVTDKSSDLYKAVTNPGAFLGGFTIPGASGVFRSAASAAGSSIKDSLIRKISSLWSTFKDAFDVSGVGGFPPGGGTGMGYQAMADWVRQYLPGVAITSTYRPGAVTSSGNTSYHAMGRALDMAPSMETFNKIKQSYGASIRELIYSPAGTAQVKDGKSHYYTGAVRDMHWNHVHWAMRDGGVVPMLKRYDQGGWLPTGLSTVLNQTGRPEPVLNSGQWDALRQGGSGVSIQNLTIEMPLTAGTLDMLSPMDRIRAARSIHEELQKIGASRT